MEQQETRKTPWIVVALAWVVVAIPLVWGVYTSVAKSRPLFQVNSKAKP